MDELSLITLAAAKSYTDEHGGGGGGTTNYNDLSNKPQIGGVTLQGNKTASDLGLATETALADKADKSAVKNEFLGTLAEWNALTVEQRKAYDTYQIKGDYAEGSGGLPDYSTTEHKTGQKWIDGKDIYERTYILKENGVDNSPISANLYEIGLTGVDIVLIKNFFSDRVSQPYVDSVPASTEIVITFKKDTGGVYLYNQHAPRNIIVTLQYTKA